MVEYCFHVVLPVDLLHFLLVLGPDKLALEVLDGLELVGEYLPLVFTVHILLTDPLPELSLADFLWIDLSYVCLA